MKRVGALLIVAVALRLGYGFTLHSPKLSPDEYSFDNRAWNWVDRGTIASDDCKPSAYRTPSYLIFLAGIYSVTGHRPEAVRVVQAFAGAGLVLMVMALARRVTNNSKAIWLAGIATALYPFFIYYDNRLIADSFVVFWLLAAILLFMRWVDRPGAWLRAAVCGGAFAILCLAKTLFIPYFALITGIELVRALIRSPQRLRVAGAAGLMVLIFSAPIYAWGMRNQRIFGRFLLDSHGGETLMQCIAYRPETKAGIYPEFIKTQPIYQQIKGMNEAEADVFFTDQAKTWIREHPGLYIRNSLANLKDFWRLYPRPDQSYPEGRMKLILISLLTEPIFLAGGLVGLIKTRGDWRRLYPIYIAILLLSVMHALITGQMRYRLPLMPYAILFAAIAAVGLF